MARQIRPGRFRYGLETVLKVRKIREKKEQEKFADKRRAYLKEKEREEHLRDEQTQRHQELRDLIGNGPMTDFSEILRRKQHLVVLKDDLDQQIEKIIEASRLLEEQREKLIAAMKDKKIIEIDRGHKVIQHRDLMQKIEMNFLDEIATERFVHDKMSRETD